jgi:isoleucyl-tRNA synthetase
MYDTLRALSLVVAPILSFTAEEIWQAMPGEREDSIFFSRFPAPDPAWHDDALAARWDRVWEIRSEVTKALEAKRAAGAIGHSLEACVRLHAGAEDRRILEALGTDELEAVFIVSQVEILAGEKLAVEIASPQGGKCERCWNYRPTVGASSDHSGLCARCLSVVTAAA